MCSTRRCEHRRADLLKLLVAESWRPYDIPVAKLPNLLIAQGLLDQVQGFAQKDEAQLRLKLRRCQLPLEKRPSATKMLSRLRRHLVWAQMGVEDLEEECRSRDLHWAELSTLRPRTVGASSSHKKELLQLGHCGATVMAQVHKQLLHDWLSVEMLEGKGISVKLLGREAALAIFMEVERPLAARPGVTTGPAWEGDQECSGKSQDRSKHEIRM
eukprot:Skav229584  [mRNA]  locus=scaffold568:918254:920730:+ [translate_table: standard]